MHKKGSFLKNKKKKKTLTILLASIDLSSPPLLFLLVFTLIFNKHDCNGGEEEEPCFAFRIIHVFVHACEACCGHSSNAHQIIMNALKCKRSFCAFFIQSLIKIN